MKRTARSLVPRLAWLLVLVVAVSLGGWGGTAGALSLEYKYDAPSVLPAAGTTPAAIIPGSSGWFRVIPRCCVAAEEAGFLYRTGSQTENALTDATGVSFRDSISSSADRAQVFGPGDKIWAVDASKLPPGSVVRDGVPAGHVSVNTTAAQIKAAITDQSPLGDFGLKQLEDGSWRIPK